MAKKSTGKAKLAKKQGTTTETRQSKVRTHNPGLAFGVVMLIIIVAIAAYAVYGGYQSGKSQERDRQKVEVAKEPLDVCVADINGVLQTVAGTARVYDVKGNVMFTVTDSNGAIGISKIPDSMLTLLRDRLAGGEVRKINLDEWSKSHYTINPFDSNSSDNADFVQGSLGWRAVNYWCESTKTMLSDDAKLIVGAGLDSKFSSEELTKYCLACGKFGNVAGLPRAADVLFGKQLSDLNSNQQAYLMYAFENVEASFTDFIEKHPDKAGGAASAAEFGMASAGDPYWLLRQMVHDELVAIVGDDFVNTNYSIKLRVDPQVQSAMQSAIDNTMQSSISLGANGQTVLDGTAVCIDSHSGFIIGLVGGRSVNAIASKLEFTETSNLGNYETAREMMEADPKLTYNSLVSYDTLSGTTECATFGALVSQGQLGVTGNTPTLANVVSMDDLMKFVTGLYVDSGARLIEQITTEGGKNVYTASSANDVSQSGVNPDMRCLIAGTTDSTGFDVVQYTKSGVAIATATSEVIVCGLYGTGSLGYSLSDSDYNMCVSTAMGVLDGVYGYYPKDPSTIDPTGVVAKKVTAAQEENSSFVIEIFTAWIDELTKMEISSTETRGEFEQAYAYYANMFSTYVGVVPDELLAEYAGKLEQVRTDRADELLQYAA